MADTGDAEGRHWWLLALAVSLVVALWTLLMPRNSENATQPALHENPDVAFEPTDWSLRPVAAVYAGTVILIALCFVVLMAAYPNSLADVGRTLRIKPPGPLLQTDPLAEIRRVRAEENKKLNTYYWVDKPKGVVHIPIALAMKNLVQTGIPGFPKGQP